ncbi:MAG: phosphoenolpyruvate mutase [Deltaproteobacteria bacterium]
MNNPKAKKLKEIITSSNLSFIMEAHDGLSAKIVQEAGFEGIWGSGLCLSAAWGVRDNNEISWTQVLEILESMSDITSIPILLDGDTGYGDFNTLRRVIKKLEQRQVAGICIEDKLFPKTNSFIDGDKQELATIEEFTGKIRAAKDFCGQDFCVVARVEAFIAGWGLGEALRRAEAYHKAGADAILIHSKKSQPEDIISFMQAWKKTSPVIIVPTKYYSTPTKVFEDLGVSVVIWANHLLRGALKIMQETAKCIFREKNLLSVEDRIAPVGEIFRLQGADELREAEKRYLPRKAALTNALILAASQGEELGNLTKDIPKAMLPVQGKPLMQHIIDTLNEMGIKNISVIRGYRKETFEGLNIPYVDNDEYDSTKEVFSLNLGKEKIQESSLILFGDILFKKHIPLLLLESPGEISIVVDYTRKDRLSDGTYRDFVACSKPYNYFDSEVFLNEMGNDLPPDRINGEWIGMMMVRNDGSKILQQTLEELAALPDFKSLRMKDLFNYIVKNGHNIRVVYLSGHWLDIDNLDDFSKASIF